MNDASSPQLRQLGVAGSKVFPLGLGCMGMSGMYGPADEAESIATIQAAVEAGVTLLDTGDFYGMGHNELLIARAIKGRRHQVQLSVKFGAQRGPDGSWLGFDSRPAAVKTWVAYSLVRLGVECIDIYRPSRLDPAVPIQETMGAIAELVKAGYVRAIGLSEVGPDTIARAHAVHPIVDLQIEYSLITRKPEQRIFPLLQQLGIGVTAYGVLSRGLLSGSRPGPAGDFRSRMPRFAGESGARNQDAIQALQSVAQDKSLTVAQLCIAWVLSKANHIVPIVGARTRSQLRESLGAVNVAFTQSELDEIERALPASAIMGTRYDERQMQMLDSER